MKKVFIILAILMFMACSNGRYKAELVRQDQTIDVYYLVGGDMDVDIWFEKTGALIMRDSQSIWFFESGKYMSFSMKRVKE